MFNTGLIRQTERPDPPFVLDLLWRKVRAVTNATLMILSVALTALGNATAEENPDDSRDQKVASPNTDSEAAPNAVEAQDTEKASEPATAATLPRVRAREELNRHSAIQPHMALFQQSEQLVPLTSNEEVFYGLFQQERSGKPQGGLLILHDLGQHGLWPDYIAPLREQLPDFGWVTLAIELPDPPAQPLPLTNLYQANESPASATEDSIDSAANTDDSTTNNAVSDDNRDASPTDQQTADSPTDDEVTQAPPPEDGNPVLDNPDLPDPTLPLNPATEPDSITDNATKNTDNSPADSPTQPKETPTALTSLEKQRSHHRQQSLDRIHNAVSYLNTRGQYNLVLVANGISASWATQWLLAQLRANSENGKAAPAAGLALILINPKESSAPLSHQRSLINQGGLANHNPLVRQLRGWLKTHAAGTEVGR
jgi:hypothetical protein